MGLTISELIKDHTEQIANVSVSGTGAYTFQTSKFFTVHVDDSGDVDFPGIAASFNDYGNHYLSMGNTDANGDAFIELFPGTHKIKAYTTIPAATGSTTTS